MLTYGAARMLESCIVPLQARKDTAQIQMCCRRVFDKLDIELKPECTIEKLKAFEQLVPALVVASHIVEANRSESFSRLHIKHSVTVVIICENERSIQIVVGKLCGSIVAFGRHHIHQMHSHVVQHQHQLFHVLLHLA